MQSPEIESLRAAMHRAACEYLRTKRNHPEHESLRAVWRAARDAYSAALAQESA